MSRRTVDLIAIEGEEDSPVWLLQDGAKRQLAASWPDAAVARWPLLAVAVLPNGAPVLARELRTLQHYVNLPKR